jgi:hypothetical protein
MTLWQLSVHSTFGFQSLQENDVFLVVTLALWNSIINYVGIWQHHITISSGEDVAWMMVGRNMSVNSKKTPNPCPRSSSWLKHKLSLTSYCVPRTQSPTLTLQKRIDNGPIQRRYRPYKSTVRKQQYSYLYDIIFYFSFDSQWRTLYLEVRGGEISTLLYLRSVRASWDQVIWVAQIMAYCTGMQLLV